MELGLDRLDGGEQARLRLGDGEQGHRSAKRGEEDGPVARFVELPSTPSFVNVCASRKLVMSHLSYNRG
jgi:hypothetical protein